ALESAMDELAAALKMDPLELRLRNYVETDPHEDKPFSSKALRQCYADAAEAFGWARRPVEAGSMRDGSALIGWGMATATYPMNRSEAGARIVFDSDGTVAVQSGTQDLGTGTYTVMAQQNCRCTASASNWATAIFRRRPSPAARRALRASARRC